MSDMVVADKEIDLSRDRRVVLTLVLHHNPGLIFSYFF